MALTNDLESTNQEGHKQQLESVLERAITQGHAQLAVNAIEQGATITSDHLDSAIKTKNASMIITILKHFTPSPSNLMNQSSEMSACLKSVRSMDEVPCNLAILALNSLAQEDNMDQEVLKKALSALTSCAEENDIDKLSQFVADNPNNQYFEMLLEQQTSEIRQHKEQLRKDIQGERIYSTINSLESLYQIQGHLDQDIRDSALKLAIKKSNARLATAAIEKGAGDLDQDICDSALKIAIKQKHEQLAEYAIGQGATITSDHLDSAIKTKNASMIITILKHFTPSPSNLMNQSSEMIACLNSVKSMADSEADSEAKKASLFLAFLAEANNIPALNKYEAILHNKPEFKALLGNKPEFKALLDEHRSKLELEKLSNDNMQAARTSLSKPGVNAYVLDEQHRRLETLSNKNMQAESTSLSKSRAKPRKGDRDFRSRLGAMLASSWQRRTGNKPSQQKGPQAPKPRQ